MTSGASTGPTAPPRPPAPKDDARTRWVALLGNPNTGKTTVFNALTGHRAKVANYPGVTVDRREGPLRALPGVHALDLPGTYSLAARSPDEMVAVDVLLGRRPETPRPDAVVLVVDASNLERNLYLASQVFETGLPVVVALNMTDIARARGHAIDLPALSAALGVPVVPMAAHRGQGIAELVAEVRRALFAPVAPPPLATFPAAFEREAEALGSVLSASGAGTTPLVERRRMLLDVAGHAEHRAAERGGPAVASAVRAARERLRAVGLPVAGLEAGVRYGAAGAVVARAVRRPAEPVATFSDRLDAVLTHRFLGAIAFAATMTFVFLAIFAWAAPLMDFLDQGIFGPLAEAVASSGWLGGGALESLVVDGVIGGVGGVLVFLPQIAILFLLLAILEDVGYLARAAFLMDRLLRWCGLSGRSFVPMLSSFACAIPGIMATRTIENRRDRLATILVAPLMSCSARIPVYALMIAAFLPGLSPLESALVFAAMYFVGIVVAVLVAWALRRTILKGAAQPFVIELPPYRLPLPGSVLRRVWEAVREFIVRAGTLILAASLVIWALMYFPHDPSIGERRDAAVAAADASVEVARAVGVKGPALDGVLASAEQAKAVAEREAQGAWSRGSWLGQAGHVIEPVFEPIGWDWKVSVAVLASFPAREVVVSTLGVIYDVEAEDESSEALRDQLRHATWESGPRAGEPVFDLGSALALMVFFALCCQCVSTLVVMRRETGSWGWPVLAFTYMTVLAWVGAFLTSAIF